MGVTTLSFEREGPNYKKKTICCRLVGSYCGMQKYRDLYVQRV